MSINTKYEVAVLDLGTSKICCAIAKGAISNKTEDIIGSEKTIRILGTGHQLAKGIKKKSITNLEKLEESILSAISTAEKEAEKTVKSLYIALPGWATKSHTIKTSISLGNLPIDEVHLNTLMNFDTSQYIDNEANEIIHVFPMTYSLDNVEGIQNPIGMVGEKLYSTLNIISSPITLLRNIKNCINRNNIEVEGFISSTYASGLSVLLEEELSLGVTLIDFGGATISISFFGDNTLLYTKTLPIGSDNITNDISIILRTMRSHAERLKILYGVTSLESEIYSTKEQCLVPKLDEYGEEHIQNISKSTLDSIISARLEEIVESIEKNIKGTIMEKRIVITGGGSRLSGLHNFIKSSKYLRNSSIRLGKPIGTIGSHDFVQTASFASTAGAIIYCLSYDHNNNYNSLYNKSLYQKIITWLKRGI